MNHRSPPSAVARKKVRSVLFKLDTSQFGFARIRFSYCCIKVSSESIPTSSNVGSHVAAGGPFASSLFFFFATCWCSCLEYFWFFISLFPDKKRKMPVDDDDDKLGVLVS